ncbi:NAD(P)/FAD-dependent oxidoreductase [Streptomyces sp. TR06-5]|uniref:NAD(P)/FAD-dependent oxidoreductase n=1 Tax=unclassified Streptomyces TaxID=2593676 RepID=UPI0039A30325
MAGVQTAVQLREQGWAGRIRLLGAEPHRPYDRPPLSKAVLLGKEADSAFDIDFDALGIDLELGTRATALRADSGVLATDRGEVRYDALVLATGAEPVALPGSEDVPGIHLLRTLDDVHRLQPVLAGGRTVVVVGAGWIGAEFTTAAREAGCEVTVVEAGDRPLPGVLPPAVAEPMRDWYARSGARLRTGAAVSSVEPGAVVLADGERLAADAVVVGVGARPATGWLEGSGVELCADGSIRGDARLRTSLPGVHAVGDCVSFPSARFGERLLVHHWDNALQGPVVVAAALTAELGGRPAEAAPVHDPVPYFWSEQFGRFVQYAGHHGEDDLLLLRGDPREASWSACWLRDGRLVALLAVGRPRDLTQGRRLIRQGAVLDTTLLADASLALKKAAR